MMVGDVSAPLALGTNWAVYRVESRTAANMADFEKQKKELTDQVLNEKRALAYEAFRSGLEERLKLGLIRHRQEKGFTSREGISWWRPPR